jgi:SAM-dependent methyltransferase
MSDSVERFSNRVENYIRYRPHYPREILGYLADNFGFRPQTVIADIGCGTGISSRLFLENGNNVIGVEPNAAMRKAATKFLAEFPGFSAVDGRSENTGLADNSVDMIIAAQAFHWFNPQTTQPEFYRILRPGGCIVLMWNERQLDSTPFHVGYEAFLVKYAYDYETVRHENITDKEISGFFQGNYHTVTFPNFQLFDFEGLKGRALSSSYMPVETDADFVAMIEELRTLFAKHAENGKIKLLYDTDVYASCV